MSLESHEFRPSWLLNDNPDPSFSQFVTVKTHSGIERQIRPMRFDQLYYHGNGIDLRFGYISNKQAADYEITCFEDITWKRSSKEGLVFGPHLIDRIIPTVYPNSSVPDAIEFSIDSDKQWVVNTLYEFKSTRVRGSGQKLKGFSTLLENMRKDDSHFPQVLKNVFSWATEESLPKKVIVPSNSEITVVFMSPRDHGPFTENTQEFKVKYKKHPTNLEEIA